jgi:hypothetical protein
MMDLSSGRLEKAKAEGERRQLRKKAWKIFLRECVAFRVNRAVRLLGLLVMTSNIFKRVLREAKTTSKISGQRVAPAILKKDPKELITSLKSTHPSGRRYF